MSIRHKRKAARKNGRPHFLPFRSFSGLFFLGLFLELFFFFPLFLCCPASSSSTASDASSGAASSCGGDVDVASSGGGGGSENKALLLAAGDTFCLAFPFACTFLPSLGLAILAFFAGVFAAARALEVAVRAAWATAAQQQPTPRQRQASEAPRLRLNASLACSGPAVRLHAARQSRAMSWAVSRARSVRRPPAPMPALRRIRRSC